MITQVNSPTLLIVCTLAFLVFGFSTFVWGRVIPGKGNWLVLAGVLALLTGIGFDSGLFLKEEFSTKIWKVGWIWPRDEVGAITIGVLEDPLSLAMSTLALIMTASFLMMNHSIYSKEPRMERIHAALAISTSGVVLAWNSLTPWLVFGGLMLTVLGGFMTLGARWDSPIEASNAARFIWERSVGFLLAFFGTCILAASRSALLLNQTEMWSSTEYIRSTWIGALLMVVGLFIQLQPFPFLGWTVAPSELYHPARTLLNQIFPAWAAFPLLIRLEPQFKELGVFPVLGWIALGSSVLGVSTGLFQTQWRSGINAWLGAGFSFAIALLAFSGPMSATGMVFGISLGAMCLSGVATALEAESKRATMNKRRAIWTKISAFLAMASGTGVIGFVSATAGVQWMIQASDFPGMAALFFCAFFVFVLLGWKLTWNIVKMKKMTDTSWSSILSFYIWVILALGVIWTGTITGGVIVGVSDRVFPSAFDLIFGSKATDLTHSDDFVSASGLYWGALILAFLTAYWTSGRKEDLWKSFGRFAPGMSRFVASGYGIDQGMGRIVEGIVWIGRTAEKLVDERIWAVWIPSFLTTGIQSSGDQVRKLDDVISTFIAAQLRRMVEIPAKILQLVQTGDVRWYLVFALGSGFALLSHFLKI